MEISVELVEYCLKELGRNKSDRTNLLFCACFLGHCATSGRTACLCQYRSHLKTPRTLTAIGRLPWLLIGVFLSSIQILSRYLRPYLVGFSTDLCTGVLKNVVSEYLHGRSDVFGCFLDASKAFDRVNHNL